MHLKMSSGKWWPFCLSLNVLIWHAGNSAWYSWLSSLRSRSQTDTYPVSPRPWRKITCKEGKDALSVTLSVTEYWMARYLLHVDVIKWKHFPRYWPFEQGIHQSPVNSPHKGQWHGALMFSLSCAWINRWVNNREAGDLRCHHAHYDITVMIRSTLSSPMFQDLTYYGVRLTEGMVLTTNLDIIPCKVSFIIKYFEFVFAENISQNAKSVFTKSEWHFRC